MRFEKQQLILTFFGEKFKISNIERESVFFTAAAGAIAAAALLPPAVEAAAAGAKHPKIK